MAVLQMMLESPFTWTLRTVVRVQKYLIAQSDSRRAARDRHYGLNG